MYICTFVYMYKVNQHFHHLFSEIAHTQSVGFPLSPTSTSPGGQAAVPLSPRYSLNLSGGMQQQPRSHTPLQNAAMGSSTSSLQGVPVIRVNLPHGQHTKVAAIMCTVTLLFSLNF